MALTIGEWIIIVVIFVIGILFILTAIWNDKTIEGVIAIVATILICILMIIGFNWRHTKTASGIRSYKDYTSELSNGINREIIITAEDGRQIFYYKGKVDVEEKDGYIRFESEEGARYIINYGVQDTIIIREIID
jgi:hypothetical protein